MPMVNWWRPINKHLLNRRAIQNDKWDVLTHTGRSSGREYQTPLGAIPVEGGFAVYLVYGRNTDWAKNILASGSGTLAREGQSYQLTNPRIVNAADVDAELPADVTRPPSFMRVNEMIRVDALETR